MKGSKENKTKERDAEERDAEERCKSAAEKRQTSSTSNSCVGTAKQWTVTTVPELQESQRAVLKRCLRSQPFWIIDCLFQYIPKYLAYMWLKFCKLPALDTLCTWSEAKRTKQSKQLLGKAAKVQVKNRENQLPAASGKAFRYDATSSTSPMLRTDCLYVCFQGAKRLDRQSFTRSNSHMGTTKQWTADISLSGGATWYASRKAPRSSDTAEKEAKHYDLKKEAWQLPASTCLDSWKDHFKTGVTLHISNHFEPNQSKTSSQKLLFAWAKVDVAGIKAHVAVIRVDVSKDKRS